MFVWIDRALAIAIHDRQLSEHGGSAGVRDEHLLDSALARPQQVFAYADPEPDLADLAAALAYGLARNHPFIDGNKRAGLLAAVVFLDLNGIGIEHPSDSLYDLTMGVAEGRLDKSAVATELERIAKLRG